MKTKVSEPETNWIAYPFDSIALDLILSKRTGWLKPLILFEIISKRPEKFVRPVNTPDSLAAQRRGRRNRAARSKAQIRNELDGVSR